MEQYYKGKTVVVTGAAGFIGSHLVDALLKLGSTVIGVDNLITGREENIAHLFDGGLESLSNLRDPNSTAPATNQPNFIFITADVTQPASNYVPEGLEIDLVFHLASPASPPRYQAYPVETYLVNSLGTHQLLSYLQRHHDQARFVYTSTSEAYGDPLVHPQPESYWGNVNPNGIRSCYDESKRLGETICGVFQRTYQMNVRIARLFNTFGPRMDPDDGRVIPNFIKQALQSNHLTIYGHGQQTRSYCYVDDLVLGLLKLGFVGTIAGETINLGNPGEYTILETAKIIQEVTGVGGDFSYQPMPEDDPQRRQPDITKARQLLNWEPTIPFREGLVKTVEYFRSSLQ